MIVKPQKDIDFDLILNGVYFDPADKTIITIRYGMYRWSHWEPATHLSENQHYSEELVSSRGYIAISVKAYIKGL